MPRPNVPQRRYRRGHMPAGGAASGSTRVTIVDQPDPMRISALEVQP